MKDNQTLTIINKECKEISVIDSREVAKMLESKHYKILEKLEGTKDGKTKGIIPILAETQINVEEYFIKSTYKDTSGKENKCYLITQKGIKMILDNTRSYKNKEKLYDFYNKYSNEYTVVLVNREEIDFINMLEETLEPFNVKGIKQYTVLDYRIDHYIPILKIAIEYDEGEHKYYSYDKQEVYLDLLRYDSCRSSRLESDGDCPDCGCILRVYVHQG